MKPIQRLNVHLNFGESEIHVGELVQDGRQILFKYTRDFLLSGLELSPYKLPLKSGIFDGPTTLNDGLFGVFDDSLPDGWGRLLLDRKLIEKGINPKEIGPLNRLALIGANGAGTLLYKPISNYIASVEKNDLELDAIAKETQQILTGTSYEILDDLYALGGPSGGARPKILVGYHPQSHDLIQDVLPLPPGYESWIIKFASSTDLPDIAEIEFAYHLMAIDAGIEVSESKLLEGKSGKKYFATKRFDRIAPNRRLHLHSMAGLVHDNFRLSTIDYGHIMDTAFFLERDVNAYTKVLRLAAFNVFAHNRDDHSKNFSFLMDANGKWKFAPAYDLTFSSSSHGMHSTTIAGEGHNPQYKHLYELAEAFSVKNAEQLILDVKRVISSWPKYAKRAGVSKTSEKMISAYLK